MICRTSCFVSIVFIVGMIYFTNMTDKYAIIKEYREQLPLHLRELYHKIVEERKAIYYKGYCLGFMLALLVLVVNKFALGYKISSIVMVCQTLMIVFLVNFFYYTLAPKTTYMLEHISTNEQSRAWLKMYRGMTFNYHFSMVIGLVAAAVMAYAFRCKP